MRTFEDYLMERLFYQTISGLGEEIEEIVLKKKSIECEEYLRRYNEYLRINNLLKYDKDNIHLIIKKERLKRQLNEMMTDE